MKKLKIILGLSLGIFLIFNLSYKSKYNDNTNYISGIIDKYKFDGSKLSLEVLGKERIACNYYFDSLEEKKEFQKKIKYGQTVYLEGTINIPSENTNFKLFNYRNYLLSKKIYYVFRVEKIEIKNNINLLYRIKNYLVKKLDEFNSPYLYAFILGDTSYIEDDVKDSFQSNGISHLLAISGMHITFLFNGLYNLLNKIKKRKSNIIIISVLLFIYLFLVGFSVSSIRAGIMFIFLKIKKIKSYKLLLAIFFLFLVYNPYLIYSLSFLLSFIVTFYLIIFKDLIKGNYLKKTFMTSLIAFIAGTPIIIYNYNSINLFSIILNLLFVPFVSYIIFPLSFISLLFNLKGVYTFFINIFEQANLFFEDIGFNLILKDISIFILIYVIVGIFVLLKLNRNKKKYLVFYFLIFIIHSNLFSFNFNVTMLDVGQGDAILIEFPFNRGNILIDTGGNEYFEEWRKTKYSISKSVTIPYMKKKGIKMLDYLIISHGDYDHMGEAINLINNFKVKEVIFNCDNYNDLENDLISILNNKNIKYSKCIKSIDKYGFQFLNTKSYLNENDNSNVIYFNYSNYKFLFMGDASYEVEKEIMNKYNLKNIDFLKVGHHGSATSSNRLFINSINPKNSLISVGRNNMYGHPKKSVLDNLKKSNIYRTDLNGSIEIKIKSDGYTIETSEP